MYETRKMKTQEKYISTAKQGPYVCRFKFVFCMKKKKSFQIITVNIVPLLK